MKEASCQPFYTLKESYSHLWPRIIYKIFCISLGATVWVTYVTALKEIVSYDRELFE